MTDPTVVLMAVASGGIGFGVAWQLGQSQAAALRKALIASTAAEQAHKALATQAEVETLEAISHLRGLRASLSAIRTDLTQARAQLEANQRTRDALQEDAKRARLRCRELGQQVSRLEAELRDAHEDARHTAANASYSLSTCANPHRGYVAQLGERGPQGPAM
jgi:chromosome segregation ATPase